MTIIPPLEFAAAVLCAFGGAPAGPPGRMIDGGWFQIVPVQRGFGHPCPDIIARNDVFFNLYNGHDINRYHSLAITDVKSLQRSGFDHTLPTIVYIHGYLGTPDSHDVNIIKKAFAARGAHNFIVVGWKELSAGPWYQIAVKNVVPMGEYLARFLDFLAKKTGPLENLHLIGHNLGAHVAGVAANSTTYVRVPRITALDPVMPSFGVSTPASRRLDPGDATFVDVLHSDYVSKSHYGHAEFFVNRKPQSGCAARSLVTRNHPLFSKVMCRRVYELYAASILHEGLYPAMRCLTLSSFQKGECRDPTEITQMGFSVPNSARGSYFLMNKSQLEGKVSRLSSPQNLY